MRLRKPEFLHFLHKEFVFRDEFRILQFLVYVSRTDEGLIVEIHRNNQYCQLLYVEEELAGTSLDREVQFEVFEFELMDETFITPLLNYLNIWDSQPFLQS